MKYKYIIIIPDVHGRTFWKEVVNKYKDNDNYHIVFLGDYLDAYPFEGFKPEDVIYNFNEIVNNANAYNNITLLIGNHDLHYIPRFETYGASRRMGMYAQDISHIFYIYSDLFKLAFEATVNNKKYLFTHAGITHGYLKRLKYSIPDFKLSANCINSLMNDRVNSKIIANVSFYRGGYNSYGSFLWADIEEHLDEKSKTFDDELNNVYQIFGHTLVYPTIDTYEENENYAMLDCRKPFILDCKTGKLNTL